MNSTSTDILFKDGIVYLHQSHGEDECFWMAISTAENLPRFIERLKFAHEKIQEMEEQEENPS